MAKQYFKHIVGNEKIKKILEERITLALIDRENLPHTIFVGNSGCGKTTFANAIAVALDQPLVSFHANSLSDTSQFKTFLEELKEIKNCIIFIDEIHQLDNKSQEKFYPILEDNSRTILAATTDTGKLLRPFQNRFKLNLQLTHYGNDDSKIIAIRYSKKINCIIPDDLIELISSRGRGVPRTLESHLEGIKLKTRFIYKISKNRIVTFTKESILEYFSDLGIDGFGLYPQEQKIIDLLYDHKKLSLSTLLGLSEIDADQYQNNYEPYLLRLELIHKTGQGRTLSPRGMFYVLQKRQLLQFDPALHNALS